MSGTPFVPPRPGATPAPVIPNPEDAYSNVHVRSRGRTPIVHYEGLPAQPPFDSGTYYTHPAHTPYAAAQPMYPIYQQTPANYFPPHLAYAGLGHSPIAPTVDTDGFSHDWNGPRAPHAASDISQPPLPRPRASSFNRPRPETNPAANYTDEWLGPREHLDYSSAPPPRQTRHARAVSTGGLPPDWIGPTHPGGYTPPIVPVPNGYEDLIDPRTGYSAYAALPPYPVAYYPRSGHTTPWRGGGYLPVTPGSETAPLPHQFERAVRPDQNIGVDTRWMSGSDYGPVLDPVNAAILKVNFKINPLLMPPPEGDSKRPFLEWCMLFQSNYARRSDEDPYVSWMKGRDSPATFPRLSSLRLISRRFTWFIDVKASHPSKGVTCGDIIDTLSTFFYEIVPEREFKAASISHQNSISAAYHHNRSRSDGVPGGRLGQGLRRCDFLLDDSMYGGIEVDMDYVRERMRMGSVKPKRDMTNIFVLKCDKNLPRTADECKAEAARGE